LTQGFVELHRLPPNFSCSGPGTCQGPITWGVRVAAKGAQVSSLLAEPI
jgi:hypothetical protein